MSKPKLAGLRRFKRIVSGGLAPKPIILGVPYGTPEVVVYQDHEVVDLEKEIKAQGEALAPEEKNFGVDWMVPKA